MPTGAAQMCATPTTRMLVSAHSPGAFLIYRQIPKGFARAAKPPRFRHPTFEAAETEAKRLLAAHPESTFVILQEVALVRADRSSMSPPTAPLGGDRPGRAQSPRSPGRANDHGGAA
jgi:hypothetical protein